MIKTASYSDIGGRRRNEDSLLIRTGGADRACAVVADGLGGHGEGDKASQAAVRVIGDSWADSVSPAGLTALIQQAHRQIHSLQTGACRMKSTVAALLLERERMVWANVGDTRLYHFVNGSLVFQTKDHSASQIAVALGQIRPEQIRFHEDRSRLYRALGMEGDVTVDAGEKCLERGEHAFLLCSDGFWEYVYENEMEKTLQSTDGPQAWLDAMRVLLRGRTPADNDNNTAAAVWLTV